MKIEKILKEERKKIDEQILAEGQDLHDQLVAKYCITETAVKKPVKKKKYVKWIASAACVIVVCLAVGLGVGLTRPKVPEYFYQNEIKIDSTIDEFSKDTNSLISFDSSYTLSNMARIDDAISSDKLYYSLEIVKSANFVIGEINVVVNKYYHFDEKHVGDIQKSKFNQYDMEYSVRETMLEDVPMNEYFGRIDYKGYKIYFSFTELHLDDTPSPNAVLNELLILK